MSTQDTVAKMRAGRSMHIGRFFGLPGRFNPVCLNTS